MSDLADKIRELVAKWRNEAAKWEELYTERGWDNAFRAQAKLKTCADELEVVLGLVGEGSEQRSWRGIAWKDSVRASTLAEEIALHFAHVCEDSMCGEDADASNCETAWIEDKLTEFLEFVVNGAAAERQMKRGTGG